MLVADDWLKFRVPLAVLSQLACLRIRVARAFAAKVRRPDGALPVELDAALQTAAAVLARDGGAAPSAGTGFEGGGGFQGGAGGSRAGARGTGTVLGAAAWFSGRSGRVFDAGRRGDRRPHPAGRTLAATRGAGVGGGEDEGVGAGEGVSFPAPGTRERRCVADFARID